VQGLELGGRYVLQDRIAAGGMSDVWRGLDGVLQREVAVKVMRADTDNEEIFAARFRDEALHSAALMHTNITTVFDYGEDDHLTYLVMELVPGLPLSAIIREQGPIEPDSVRSIIGQAALALGVAHEMLNGERPFDRGTPIATAMSHVNEPPPPLPEGVPIELRAVVEALLEKKPADRPANARAVAQMLGIADNELSGLAEGLASAVSGEFVDDTRTPVTDLPTMAAQRDEPLD
jgi:serine/threonine protein kinase